MPTKDICEKCLNRWYRSLFRKFLKAQGKTLCDNPDKCPYFDKVDDLRS